MSSFEPPWLVAARDEVGLQEIKGPLNQPRILALARAAGLPWVQNDEIPWCATFLGGILAECGLKPSGSAAARSYMHWGKDVLESGPLMVPLGAILVYARPPNPTEGHVNFAAGYTSDGFLMGVGGNQGDKVSIAKFDPRRVISARWPDTGNPFDIRMLRRIPLLSANGAPISAGES